MILLNAKAQTKGTTSSPLINSSSEKTTTLSFSSLLKGAGAKELTQSSTKEINSSKDDSKVLKDIALVLDFKEGKEDSSKLKDSSKTELLGKLLNTTQTDKEDIATLNPQAIEGLDEKEVKVLISKAKEFLKDKILQSDEYKLAQIKELPTTLKGLVDISSKLGINLNKISFEEVQVKSETLGVKSFENTTAALEAKQSKSLKSSPEPSQNPLSKIMQDKSVTPSELKSQTPLETKAEAKAEPKAELKSQTPLEVKTELKQESKTELKQELKAQTPLETKAELKAETKAEAKVEPKAELKSQTPLEVKTELKQEPKTELKQELKAQTPLETKAEAKVEPKAELKSQTPLEVKTELKQEPKTELKQELKSQTPLETKAEAKVEPKAELKSQTPLEVNTELKQEPKTELKQELKAQTPLETKAEAKVEPKQELKAQTPLETKAEVKTDTKLQTPLETKVQTKTEIQADIKTVQKNTDEKITQTTQQNSVAQNSEQKATPLFKAQVRSEYSTQELISSRQVKTEDKTQKTRASDTLGLLLRGEKVSQANPALTADFSVATARVIAPTATTEATKNLESLLHGETSSETTSSILKTDGLNVNKADSLELKLNEAKQMIKYISQDVKTAIDDYKSPFTRVKVQLNPQRLGEVDVTIVQRGNNLHVNISSNNTAINALSMNANELRAQLNNNGINNATLNFNNQSQSDSQNSQQQQRERQKDAHQEYNYFESEESKEEILSSLEIVVPSYA